MTEHEVTECSIHYMDLPNRGDVVLKAEEGWKHFDLDRYNYRRFIETTFPENKSDNNNFIASLIHHLSSGDDLSAHIYADRTNLQAVGLSIDNVNPNMAIWMARACNGNIYLDDSALMEEDPDDWYEENVKQPMANRVISVASSWKTLPQIEITPMPHVWNPMIERTTENVVVDHDPSEYEKLNLVGRLMYGPNTPQHFLVAKGLQNHYAIDIGGKQMIFPINYYNSQVFTFESEEFGYLFTISPNESTTDAFGRKVEGLDYQSPTDRPLEELDVIKSLIEGYGWNITDVHIDAGPGRSALEFIGHDMETLTHPSLRGNDLTVKYAEANRGFVKIAKDDENLTFKVGGAQALALSFLADNVFLKALDDESEPDYDGRFVDRNLPLYIELDELRREHDIW